MKAYIKTYKRTLQSLRETSDIEKPKSAYETVRKSFAKVATAVALLKNYRQVVYARQAVSSQSKVVDSIRYELMRATVKNQARILCGRFRVLQKEYQFLLHILKSMTLSDFVFCLILQNALRYQLI